MIKSEKIRQINECQKIQLLRTIYTWFENPCINHDLKIALLIVNVPNFNYNIFFQKEMKKGLNAPYVMQALQQEEV